MKEGLIRLTNEKNIFYDSIERVYRYRIHCPNCGIIVPTCRCYNDLDLLLSDIYEKISDCYCSSKCLLLGGEWDEITYAMIECCIDPETKIEDLTEKQAKEIKDILIEGADFDYPNGDFCST